MGKMTAKQQLFCKEYLVDLNATQAAIRAGYSSRRADAIGHENLRKPEIAAVVQELMNVRSQKTEVNAEYVLKRLHDIDSMNVTDILNDDWTLKPLSQWPVVWQTYLSSFDVQEMRMGQESSDSAVAFLKKIKWPDKVKILELLGKHVSVSAFADKVDHSSSDGSMTPPTIIQVVCLDSDS